MGTDYGAQSVTMSIGLLPGMQLLFSDIMLEAMDPAVIPPAVKPIAVSTRGVAATTHYEQYEFR